jgi:hypothetical protein
MRHRIRTNAIASAAIAAAAIFVFAETTRAADKVCAEKGVPTVEPFDIYDTSTASVPIRKGHKSEIAPFACKVTEEHRRINIALGDKSVWVLSSQFDFNFKPLEPGPSHRNIYRPAGVLSRNVKPENFRRFDIIVIERIETYRLSRRESPHTAVPSGATFPVNPMDLQQQELGATQRNG